MGLKATWIRQMQQRENMKFLRLLPTLKCDATLCYISTTSSSNKLKPIIIINEANYEDFYFS